MNPTSRIDKVRAALHLIAAKEHAVKAVVRAWAPFAARGVIQEEQYYELQNCRIARNLLSEHMARRRRSIRQGGSEYESGACTSEDKGHR